MQEHLMWIGVQVSLMALRAPTSPLAAVNSQLQQLLSEDAGRPTAQDSAAIVRSVNQALRLYACVFRSSLRGCVTAPCTVHETLPYDCKLMTVCVHLCDCLADTHT